MSELKRLNKYISETGFCSRREADKLIEAGKVTVNGQRPEIGVKVSDKDKVTVNNKPLKNKKRKVYMAFNKPVGVTCTTDSKDPDNIIDFIRYGERIFPIGRLDKMSEGLIFMTSDGDIVNKILRAGNNHEKEYIVSVDKPITQEFVKKMSSGVKILGTTTLPCTVVKLNKNTFKIILTQGLNRQIRRMSEVLGFKVTKLERVRIMTISLKGIEQGAWRYLTESEMKKINLLVSESSKTEEASNSPKVVKKKKVSKPKYTRRTEEKKSSKEDTKYKKNPRKKNKNKRKRI